MYSGVIENVQNYMEYAYCSKMFTAGQVQVMRGVLNTSTADRDNLWTKANLEATGTNDGYLSLCAPVADFKANHFYSCQGDQIIFTDYSWNGGATNWSWDFPGGTPSSSNEQNPVIAFNEPGKHTITLTSSNAAGSSTVSKDVYISGPVAQYANYYYENFEDPVTFSNDWIVKNVDNNNSFWSLTRTLATTAAALW
jgi:PKD repeat protein